MTDMIKLEELAGRLRKEAYAQFEVLKMMAEQKSLRQPDNEEGRKDLYSYPAIETIAEMQAAEALLALSKENAALKEALRLANDPTQRLARRMGGEFVPHPPVCEECGGKGVHSFPCSMRD